MPSQKKENPFTRLSVKVGIFRNSVLMHFEAQGLPTSILIRTLLKRFLGRGFKCHNSVAVFVRQAKSARESVNGTARSRVVYVSGRFG